MGALLAYMCIECVQLGQKTELEALELVFAEGGKVSRK